MTPSQLRGVLARNVRQQAKARGLALNSLADFAGVSRSQLYDVLARRKAASIDWLAKIAKALDVPPSQLLAP
ncbi:MAG: helix-turn-helix transcriptional regulator [Myxococcales bacterium]|nr:helix-turn-helix transcriptional regulator [Myxococcales bacterium]